MSSALALRTALIACLLLVALAGCSSLRLGYQQGPTLARWWLDRQFDFDAEQKPRVHVAVDEFFSWHRRAELPPIADLLARVRGAVDGRLDGARICGWETEAKQHANAAFEHALPALADLALTLAPSQIDRFERRLAEAARDRRSEWLPPSPETRRRRATERAEDRAEELYGRLNADQRRWLGDAVAALPSGPERVLDDREAQNAALIATLRRIQARRPDASQVAVALREQWQAAAESPDPVTRARRHAATEAQCALTAELHDRATPAQRRTAAQRLAGWEADARELAARPR